MNLAAVGHPHDGRFRRQQEARLPFRFRAPVAKRYAATYEGEGRAAANLFLLDVGERLDGGAWRLAASDSELCTFAERRAEDCARAAARYSDLEVAYLVLAELCNRAGIAAPEIDEETTAAGAVARMTDPVWWWRRQVRKTHGRQIEQLALELGLVGSHAGLYCSDEAVERRGQQKRRNRSMMEQWLAVNELGESFTLAELADLSVSNPALRYGELMLRIAGTEAVADESGHVGMFVTATVPSRMHASSDKYDGTTPREAADWLGATFAKARSALGRRGLQVYGFRVAEPHKDGTPHWHMLLWMERPAYYSVRRLLRAYWLGKAGKGDPSADGNEDGAWRYRCQIKRVRKDIRTKDGKKSSAAGYLAKYIAKNINGFEGYDLGGPIDEDLTGKRDPKECAARVDAWASTWGIRQFQQIGGAPVGVWRELRRLAEGQPGIIEAARKATDKTEDHPASWAEFLHVMGGPLAKREERPIAIAKVYDEAPGRYGEPKGDRVYGVAHGPIVVQSRVHQWSLQHGNAKEADVSRGWTFKGPSLEEMQGESERRLSRLPLRHKNGVGGVRISQAFAFERRRGLPLDAFHEPLHAAHVGAFLRAQVFCAPWSPVNNCTGAGNEGEVGEDKNRREAGQDGAAFRETATPRSDGRRVNRAPGGIDRPSREAGGRDRWQNGVN